MEAPESSEDHHHLHHHNDEEEEEDVHEDSLSLRDLPLDRNDNFPKTSSTNQTPRRSSCSGHPDDDDDNHFFEFLCSDNDNMISAEDIIFHGKLIPYKEPFNEEEEKGDRRRTVFRRRSESLSGLRSAVITRSDSTKNSNNYKILLRNSRSLDYQKLRRFPSSNMERNSSVRSTGKSDKKSATAATGKPRWYFFMFGMVRFPSPEMDLRDIKSRQFRRTNSLIFPSSESSGKYTSSSSSSWKFLKALSCKDHGSVAATVPFCVSHA